MNSIDPSPHPGAGGRRDLRLRPGQLRFLGVFLAGLLILRLVLAIAVPFTDTTEARYAEIARIMVETGDWITPQFDYGIPFWGKPPLHTWLAAVGMRLLGPTEIGGRVLIFAGTLLTVLLVFVWARQQRGPAFALVGTVVLSSSLLFFGAAAFVMTDMVMVAGTSLAMVAFWRARQAPSRYTWGLLLFVGLAIGLLAKGPVAVVLAGLPIGAWILLHNRWRETWRESWRESWRAIPWLYGSLLLVAMVGPWFAIAEWKTPGFLNYFLVGEHFQRFLVAGWQGDLYGSAHSEPKGMIWLFFVAGFLPWSLFLLAPVFRARRVLARARQADDGWLLYLVLWSAAPLVLFTPAANILTAYILPGLPAASLLLVELWRLAFTGAAGKRFPAWSARAAAIACLVAAAAFSYPLAVAGDADGEIGRKTQKFLVQQLAPYLSEDTGELLYLGKRRFSADFYTAGQATAVDGFGQLETALAQSSRDFVAVPTAYVDQLPQDVMARLSSIGVFRGTSLFVEEPRPDPSLMPQEKFSVAID